MKKHTEVLLLIFSFIVVFSYEIKATEEENVPDVRTPLATAANLNSGIASIEGTGFATGTDSLKAISTTLGTPVADVSVDIAAIKTDTAAILVGASTVGVLDQIKNLGTSSDTSALYTTFAYIIANVQVDPIAQVNNAKGLDALTTTVILAGSPVAGTTTALNTYNTNIATAITDTTTATALGTQTTTSTTAAITSVNTAITNFDTFMAALLADASYSSTVYINSAAYGESTIKWALYQLLWTLNQLQEKQATL